MQQSIQKVKPLVIFSLEDIEKDFMKGKPISLDSIEKEIFSKKTPVTIQLEMSPCGEKLKKEAEKYLIEIEEWTKLTFKF
jgi:hypothetical protein